MTSSERLLNSILNQPAPLNDQAYSGYYYAFYGFGGFSVDQSFNPILLNPNPPITSTSFQLYDVTYAVQVKYDVRSFNDKIGLVKDASNTAILSTTFDISKNHFPIDSININADEFINGMSPEQVISVGAYQTLYSEYLQSINSYFFNIPSLNAYLLSEASAHDISNGIFDSNQLMNLISQQTDISNQLVYNLNGFITLSNINQLIQYAVIKNVFGNRQPIDSSGNNSPPSVKLQNLFVDSTVTDLSNNIITTTNYDEDTNTTTITIEDNSNNSITTIVDDISNNISTVTTTDNQIPSTTIGTFNDIVTPTYADVSFSHVPGHYSVSNGFLAGDLIFIPAGLTVTLELSIDPMVDASTSSIKDLILNTGLQYEYAINLDNINTQKTTAISKILTAPLLIELVNLS
jgi:hypothetical protein